MAVAIATAGAAQAAQPKSDAAFLQTIGVATHLAYTDGAYVNVPQVIADLKYLGINAVRDGISNGIDPFTGQPNGSAPLATYQTVAASGIQFTFLTFGGGAVTSAILNSQLGLMQQVLAATPGSVFTIEGPNEINNFPVTWRGKPDATCPEELADALGLQRAIYSRVKHGGAFPGVAVTMLTGAAAYLNQDACTLADHPNVGAVAGFANYDNQHPYPNGGTAPDYWVNPANNVPGNTAPLLYTETGYSSAGGTNGAVDEYVQSMYGLDLYFDAAYYGVTRTYWYDLLDAYAPGSPQGDDYYGLFDYMGNAKPIAVALHNLHAIMQDTGGHAARTPSFTTQGLPPTGKFMALARRDGSSGDFVVWAEPVLWNEQTGMDVPPLTETVTILLGQTYRTVQVFDPTTGTASVQTTSGVSQIAVTLSDHPLIVRGSK